MPFGSKAVTELPPSSKRGGKAAIRPQLEAWVDGLKAGTTQLTEDGNEAFPFPRSTTIRQIVEVKKLTATHKVITRPATKDGKPVDGRYFIYVEVSAPSPNGGKS